MKIIEEHLTWGKLKGFLRFFICVMYFVMGAGIA